MSLQPQMTKRTVRQLGPYCVTSLASLKVQPSSERSWCKAAALSNVRGALQHCQLQSPNDKKTVRQVGPYCVTSLASLKVQLQLGAVVVQGCRVIAMCAALCNNVTTAPNDKWTVRQMGPYCVTSLA